MKRFGVALTVLSLLVFFAAASHAGKTFTYPPNNPVLTITFPDSWSVKPDPDESKGIIATTPDEEIEIDLWPLDKKEADKDMEKALEEAAADVATLIIQWVTDFKGNEKPELFTVNDIVFCEIKGTGKDKEDSTPVKVSATFFSPDDQTLFVMMYWGSENGEVKYAADLAEIAKSLKRP
jgi:hypothetical protein